jgi:catechol 2,3-dioxygenase-like lactoylglutathione lyase family enzyme
VITGTRHTGLVVSDLILSLGFYRDLLGFNVCNQAVEEGEYIEKVVGIEGAKLKWAKLKAPDGSLIELIQYLSHPEQNRPVVNNPSNRPGSSHIAFTVDDIDGLYNR